MFARSVPPLPPCGRAALVTELFDGTANDGRRDGHQGAGRPGRRAHLRLPRRRRAADLRRAVPAGEGQAHPGAPGGRRSACSRRLRPVDRQGRGRTGDVRPRRHELRNRADRCADGFHSRRVHHRPGAHAPDRQRRLPGVRHRRHHAALHQAQLARQERRRPRAHPARGLLRRPHRPSGPGGGRHPQGRAVRHRHLYRPQGRPAQDLPAPRQGRCQGHRPGRRADEPGQETAALHRRRRHQFGAQGQPAAARARQAHGLSHHLDADGARRLPGFVQGVARHARHARHLRGQPRHARLRRDGVHRRALRRPHHRPRRPVLAPLQENPHRHRPLLDQQERQGARADHRRCSLRAGGADPHLEGQGRHRRQDHAQILVGADRQVAGQEVPQLQEAPAT